jgi:hypothetical protein
MNTFDCNAGFSLITARPADPTYPSPMPAPNAARPNARPAPKILSEPESADAAAPSSAANAMPVIAENDMTAVKSNNVKDFIFDFAPEFPYLNHGVVFWILSSVLVLNDLNSDLIVFA